MPTIKKRAYNSDNRLAQAAQTKSRILAVAQELFKTEGFELVTIEKIAQAAEVSAPTIYALFQSKRGIMRALMDEALPTGTRLALVEVIKEEKSPQERLKTAAKLSRQMYDAERAHMEIFRGASVLAPEFKELEEEREQRRYKRQEESVRVMAAEGALIKELSITKARDIGWALTGRDMYRMLVIERGWSSDAYENWLAELLIKTLIKEN